MRPLRLALIGLASLLPLSGPGGGALAQGTPSDDAAYPQLTRGVVYGADDSSRQILHVLEPEPRATPRPAVVFFHGGGLIMGLPIQDLSWAEALAKQGYVAFMAGYRLFDRQTGEDPWPAQIDDARHAIRWIRAHADEFDVDPERVCAIGHSSGGHLSGLLGTTEGDADPDLPGLSSRVDCVVMLAGDADLTVPYGDVFWNDLFEIVLGGTLAERPELFEAASPTHNVDEDTVPFLIIHGNRDSMVPVEMSRNLADALAQAGVEHVYAELPAGHMDLVGKEAAVALVDAFLAFQLHPAE